MIRLLPALALLAFALPAAARTDRVDSSFELYDLRTDRLVRLARVRRGADLVLVDFFSVSCRPCRRALPAWTKLLTRHPRLKLVLVAVPDSDDREAALRRARRYFKRHPVPFPVVWDKYLVVAKRYGVARQGTVQLPRVFVLDRGGKLLLRAREPRPVIELLRSR